MILQGCFPYNILQKTIAWTIVTILGMIAAFMLYSQAKKVRPDSEAQFKTFTGYWLFFLGYALTRVFFILSDFERLKNCTTVLYTQLVLGGYCVGIFSALMLIQIIERIALNMPKGIVTKFYSLVAIACVVFLIATPYIVGYLNTIRLIFISISGIGAVILIILYLKVISLTTGSIRKSAFLTFFGVLLTFMGTMADSELIIGKLAIPIWAPSIFAIAGILLLIKALRNI